MLRQLAIGAAACVLAAGCANGWPRVHHLHQTAANGCMPTGSKISRDDCATSQPSSSQSQGDIDRQGGQGMGTVSIPAQSQSLPR